PIERWRGIEREGFGTWVGGEDKKAGLGGREKEGDKRGFQARQNDWRLPGGRYVPNSSQWHLGITAVSGGSEPWKSGVSGRVGRGEYKLKLAK
ncbi:hypothetical protein JOQ06_016497, partial [Pogonophryne albipinna]